MLEQVVVVILLFIDLFVWFVNDDFRGLLLFISPIVLWSTFSLTPFGWFRSSGWLKKIDDCIFAHFISKYFFACSSQLLLRYKQCLLLILWSNFVGSLMCKHLTNEFIMALIKLNVQSFFFFFICCLECSKAEFTYSQKCLEFEIVTGSSIFKILETIACSELRISPEISFLKSYSLTHTLI